MTDRETTEEPAETGAPTPESDGSSSEDAGEPGDSTDSGGSSESGQDGPFRYRLRKRYGPAIDPHISLGPTTTTQPVPAADPAATKDDLEDEDEQLPSQKRIERLEKLMPAEYRYKFKREIGRGGMGAVLEVRDRDLDRRLAMKVIAGRGTNPSDGVPTDRGKIARFLEEAQITGQLSHPGIVPVHEIGMDARGRLFFTMRLVKGHDLKEVFAAIHGETTDDPSLSGWTLNRALSSVLRVCETMAFAHSNGVIHRDIKPSNIMVGSFGETYVMDWGLAKLLNRKDTRNLRVLTDEDASGSFVRTDRAAEADMDPDSPLVTMDGTVVGTPAYMAPEQAKGETDKIGPKSDIYSAGALLYHLLTGRAPYAEPEGRQNPHVVLMKVLAGPPPRIHKLRKGVPSELCAIAEKAMSYGRKQRYETMLELAEDLQAYLEGRVVTAYQTGSVAEFKKWVERNKAFAAVIAFAMLAIMVTVGRIGYIQNKNNEDLAKNNALLTEAKLLANNEAEAATTSKEEAEEARNAAIASDLASRREGYLSSILAATSSLRLDETAVAVQYLDVADEEFAGWELDHLRLSADTSLDVWPAGINTQPQAAWSPTGNWIASVRDGSHGTIELRQTPTGKVLDTLEGHKNPPTDLAFSPDGRWLASCASNNEARLWDLESGTGIALPGKGTIKAMRFSSDGEELIGAGIGGQLWIWELDLEDPEPMADIVHTQQDEGGALNALAVDPKGRWIATGSEEGLVRLWSVEELRSVAPMTPIELRRPLDSSLSAVASLAFAPGGELLAVTTEDGRVRVLSTARFAAEQSGSVISQQSLSGTVAEDCLFLPDGRLVLACSDGVIRLLSLAGGKLAAVHGHVGPITALALSEDGSQLLSASADRTLRLWSCYALLPTTLFTGHREKVRDLCFSPDGGTLATASDDGTVWLWDATSGEVHHILRGHSNYVRSLAYSSDGEWLASGSGDRSIRLWDAETGELFTIWDGHTKWVSDLAFSPDDRYLASASGDGTCRIWDVEEERCVTVFEGHGKWIHSLAWNAAGTRVLSGDSIGRVIEWDPFSGEVQAEYELSDTSIARVEWGPGPNQVTAVGMDGRLRVVDETGAVQVDLQAHEKGVSAMGFSPDGSRLLTGDRTGELLLWDTDDWSPTLTLHTNESGVPSVLDRQISSCAFSPDGTRIATSRGKLVRIWETSTTSQRHETMLAARRVMGLVDDLFTDLGLPSLVLDSLRENRDISGKFREAAIRSVTAASKDPELLSAQAWELINDQDAGADSWRNALVLAEMAHDLKPDEPTYRCAVAAASYRVNDFELAMELLLALEAEEYHAQLDPHPEVQILLAMCEFQLGKGAESAERLVKLDAEMARPLWQRLAGDLYEEARLLILEGD